MLKSRRGVIMHPIGFGFILGLIIGLVLGGLLTFMAISGNWNIPFIGG